MTEKHARVLAVFGGAWSLLFAAAHYYWAAGAGLSFLLARSLPGTADLTVFPGQP